MATNDVQLTGGIRSNLLLLQQTAQMLERTQQRLATGNRINTALDGPVNFFAAKGLNRRADDLTQIKDAIGQAISTIKAADTTLKSSNRRPDQTMTDLRACLHRGLAEPGPSRQRAIDERSGSYPCLSTCPALSFSVATMPTHTAVSDAPTIVKRVNLRAV